LVVSAGVTENGALLQPCAVIGFIAALGLTLIVKVADGPGQPLAVGVTIIVAIAAVSIGLVAVNEAIFPAPVAGRPMDVLLLVQLYVAVATDPVKLIGAVGLPLHTIWLPGFTTEAVGLTVIVKVTGVPGQLFATGITVMVAIIGAPVKLVAGNAAMLPVPLAARPIDGAVALFVQLYATPATALPVKVIAAVVCPLHKA
jgi:hypothetical protein